MWVPPEGTIHVGCDVDPLQLGSFLGLTRLFSAQVTRVDLEMRYLFLVTEAGTYIAQGVVVWVVKGSVERFNSNFVTSRRAHTFRERSPPANLQFDTVDFATQYRFG